MVSTVTWVRRENGLVREADPSWPVFCQQESQSLCMRLEGTYGKQGHRGSLRGVTYSLGVLKGSLPLLSIERTAWSFLILGPNNT